MSQLTKHALVDSFKKLLKKKPLKKITVSDITSKCGINRMTFYYHFKDIYDLVEWEFSDKFRAALGEIGNYDTWQRAYLQVYLMVLDEKDFIQRIFPSMELSNIEKFLFKSARELIVRAIDTFPESLQLSKEDKLFISEFYQYAMVGTFLNWISGGMTEDPVQIVDRFSLMAQGTLPRSIKQFANKKTEE